MRRGLAALAVVLTAALTATLTLGSGTADASEGDTPPPVSGRRLSVPESILPADVLARVELVRANTELLRLFMGKPAAPAPLLRATEAQPREVYSQALNLHVRANRLAFEQVRVVRNDILATTGDVRPADVFRVVDSALAAVLLVKRELGIADAVAEERRAESTTPSDVFDAAVHAGAEVDNLLEQRTSPSDVFELVTGAVHTAATLHATIPSGPPLPDEPAFEPNRMPKDVWRRLRRCFDLIARLAAARETSALSLAPVDIDTTAVAQKDVSDLAALVAEELTNLHRHFPSARTPVRAYYPGRRFPAHVYQRAGLLELILEDLVTAYAGNDAPPDTGS